MSQSASRMLLNKKLSISQVNTPKYVQSKIYISTRHVNNHHSNNMPTTNSSIKKVIDAKLDLIKQQISKQISQHYNKQILKNSTKNKNSLNHSLKRLVSNQKSKQTSKTKQKLRSYSKTSKIKSSSLRQHQSSQKSSSLRQHQSSQKSLSHYPRQQDKMYNKANIKSMTMSRQNVYNNNQEYLNGLKPKRLFGGQQQDAIQQVKHNNNNNNNNGKKKSMYSSLKQDQRTKLFSNHSLVGGRRGYQHKDRQDYPNRNLYIEPSSNNRAQQDQQQNQLTLIKLKLSIQQFILYPNSESMQDLLYLLKSISIHQLTKQNQDYIQQSEQQSEQHNNNKHKSKKQSFQRLSESLNYLLACYSDIQQFNNELKYMLNLTGTRSLEEMKQLLLVEYGRQNNYRTSKIQNNSNQITSGMDQFTYKMLQLQSRNNRIKNQYQKMIVDMRQKHQIQMYTQRKQTQRLIAQYINKINQLDEQSIEQHNQYKQVLTTIDKMIGYYSQEVGKFSIDQKHKKDNCYENETRNMNLNKDKFNKKIKKLSQFTLQNCLLSSTTPKYQGQTFVINKQKQSLNKEQQQHNKNLKNQLDNHIEHKQHHSLLSPSPQSQSRSRQYINQKNRSQKPSIQYRLNNNNQDIYIPSQIHELQKLFEFLVQKLNQIQGQAQQNLTKMKQANAAILVLDQKMQQIKYELEEQVHQEQQKRIQQQQKVVQCEQLLNQYSQQITMLQQKIKQLQQTNQSQLSKITIYESQQRQRQSKSLQLNLKLSQKQTIITRLSNSLNQLIFLVKNTITTCLNEQLVEVMQYLQKEIKGNSIINRSDIMSQLFKIGQLFSGLSKFNTGGTKHNIYNTQLITSSIPIQLLLNTSQLTITLNNQLTDMIKQHNILIKQSITKFLQLTSTSILQQHKQYTTKQKQCFSYQQKIKHYQKTILSLQTNLNQSILQKQQYQYLLTDIRNQFQLYKTQKQQQHKQIIYKKDQQLLKSNRLILQTNSKLNKDIIQMRQQNSRLNKQLQQKINQRTFYRRKNQQMQILFGQKDGKILQLQKQSNKYKQYLQQIQQSFQSLVKNEQISSMKIITLQRQKISVKQQIQHLRTLSRSLQQQNNQYRESANKMQMQITRLNKLVEELLQVKQHYQTINVQMRMRNVQMQESNAELNNRIKHYETQISKQKRLMDKLQRIYNQTLSKIEKLQQQKQINKRNQVNTISQLKQKLKCQRQQIIRLRQLNDNVLQEGQQIIRLKQLNENVLKGKDNIIQSLQKQISKLNQQIIRIAHRQYKKGYEQAQQKILYQQQHKIKQLKDQQPIEQTTTVSEYNINFQQLIQKQQMIQQQYIKLSQRQKQFQFKQHLMQQQVQKNIVKQHQIKQQRQKLLLVREQQLDVKQLQLQKLIKMVYQRDKVYYQTNQTYKGQLQSKSLTRQNNLAQLIRQIQVRQNILNQRIKQYENKKQNILDQGISLVQIQVKYKQINLLSEQIIVKNKQLEQRQHNMIQKQQQIIKAMLQLQIKSMQINIKIEQLDRQYIKIKEEKLQLQQHTNRINSQVIRIKQLKDQLTQLKIEVEEQYRKYNSQIQVQIKQIDDKFTVRLLELSRIQEQANCVRIGLQIMQEKFRQKQRQFTIQQIRFQQVQKEIQIIKMQLNKKQQDFNQRQEQLIVKQTQLIAKQNKLYNQQIQLNQRQVQVNIKQLQLEQRLNRQKQLNNFNKEQQLHKLQQINLNDQQQQHNNVNDDIQSQINANTQSSHSYLSLSQTNKQHGLSHKNNQQLTHTLISQEKHSYIVQPQLKYNQTQQLIQSVKQQSFSQTNVKVNSLQQKICAEQFLQTEYQDKENQKYSRKQQLDHKNGKSFISQEQDNNPNDIARLYSNTKLISEQHLEKSNVQWIREFNKILSAILLQTQLQETLGIWYFSQIKEKYLKLKNKITRSNMTLQLDISAIQYKNSLSSPSSTSGYKDLLYHGASKTQGFRHNTDNDQRQSPLLRQNIIQRTNQNLSDKSTLTQKQQMDHFKQLKTLLNKRVQQLQQQNAHLKSQLQQYSPDVIKQNNQLKSKLYAFQNFQDETTIKSLWNMFDKIIIAFNEDNLQNFQSTCRIMMKMLRYPEKKINQFQIQSMNRKSKNKLSSFFTKWGFGRSGSADKKDRGLSGAKKEDISPKKKNNS